MPSTGAGGLGGLTGGCDGVTGGRVAKRGLSHTSHRILLAALTIVQLRHCHSDKDTLIYTHIKIHRYTETHLHSTTVPEVPGLSCFLKK